MPRHCARREETTIAKERPTTIDEYIETAAPVAQPHLREMYRILKEVAPEGTEAIKWNVPMFWDGRVLFGFAAFKAHISFGPGSHAIEHFSAELADYKTGTDTMQLPYNRPIPEDLVRRIAEFCVANPPADG